MFIVLETKIDLAKLCKKFNQLGFDGYKYTDVRGFLGGTDIAWKQEKMTITIKHKHF